MKEVEILVRVFAKKNIVEKKLYKSAKFIGNVQVEDVYYYDPLRKGTYFRKDGRFSESFRIRKKNKKAYVAHKHDIFDKNDVWLYSNELETEIGNLGTAQKILEALGMKKLVNFKILKRNFRTKEYDIVLENVRGLGLFLEVEALRIKKGEAITAVKKRIWDFIKSLKIKTSKELGMGKPELYLLKSKP